MQENVFKNSQEEFKPRVERATPKDWKDIRDLRIEAIKGEDSKKFGYFTEESIQKEEEKSEEEWKKDLNSLDQIFVLSKNGSDSVGFGRAIQEKEGVWRMGWAYTREEFRNKGFGKMNSIFRLKELLKLNPKEIKLFVVEDNDVSLHIQESLGFKIVKKIPEDKLILMRLDLTNPDVIKKINDFVI